MSEPFTVSLSRDTNNVYLNLEKLGSPLLVILGDSGPYLPLSIAGACGPEARQGRFEMTESHEASAATLQALSRHELPVETPSPATVLITKQEVVLGTKAAVQAYLVDQGNSLCCVGDRPDVAALDGYTPTAALPIAVEFTSSAPACNARFTDYEHVRRRDGNLRVRVARDLRPRHTEPTGAA